MALSNSSRYTVVFTLFAFLLIAGCASKGGRTEDASPASSAQSGPRLLSAGKSIANVDVSLDSTALAADVLPVAEQFSVASKLADSMRARNEVGEGSLDLDVKVVSMRLRSVGNAIALGLMSGVDWIAIRVTVTENGAEVKQFEERSTNSASGFAYGGREKRVDRMVRDLTNRIIKQMQ